MKRINKIIWAILIIMCMLSVGIVGLAFDTTSYVPRLSYDIRERELARQEFVNGSIALGIFLLIFLLILILIKKLKLKDKKMNFNLKLLFIEAILISITEIGTLYKAFDTAGMLSHIQTTLIWVILKRLVVFITLLILLITSIISIIQASKLEENRAKNIIGIIIESIVVIGLIIAMPFMVELIIYIF